MMQKACYSASSRAVIISDTWDNHLMSRRGAGMKDWQNVCLQMPETCARHIQNSLEDIINDRQIHRSNYMLMFQPQLMFVPNRQRFVDDAEVLERRHQAQP